MKMDIARRQEIRLNSLPDMTQETARETCNPMHGNGERRYLSRQKEINRNQKFPVSSMARQSNAAGNMPFNSGGKRILKLKVKTELMDSYPNNVVWDHGKGVH
ncbi:hypothetical protein [Desulfovibrio sp. JC022]|uniref:hypothetical protein n=1 Tax=Desulfovibrio sp. JC022 TaxID=2593642 RepID=UPI0013D58B4E|nr:hypothetical protein [Desulfovibrio sp. JC022]NDV23091.1 hypothetical protein [Desulfovibrio sp. JC022]